ncbi:hypothetical protein VP01_2808g1 [Puccinia sorghi]|uniref:Uncharacterized protein n=1 Tax=Puccinia sorghi TaxID=27349 RepID=A0A0L6V2G6_9BASI|nr:hypothetical protein VP01_2808g1 [Puccinia sorghi]
MAVKNLIILASLVPMMIGWAMPMSYHSAKLSIRTTQEGTDAASSATFGNLSGLRTRKDDSTVPMPTVDTDSPLKESADKTTPEPMDSAKPTSREADNSSEYAASSKSSKQTSPTVPSSSSNNNSPSHTGSLPSKNLWTDDFDVGCLFLYVAADERSVLPAFN